MADSVERKLNMSLDDLAKKDRSKPRPQNLQHDNNGPGPQRHQNRQQQQGPMGNWPWRGQGNGTQHQSHQHQPRMHPGAGGGRGQGRQGWGMQGRGPQQQQRWEDMGGYLQQQQGHFQQQPQQTGSVFARLGATNGSGQYMQEQQYPQQQHQQFQQRRQQRPEGYMQQQQQQQQPQQRQRPMQPTPRPVKPKLECFEQEEGHASLYHEGHLIIQVGPLGDMLLDSGDNHSPERRAAFNIALSHFNIAVRESPGAVPDAQPSWSVSEGHRLTRFTDGMKIASRGPLTANRAAVLLAAYGENSGEAHAAAEAAQEASRKAAVAAGLLPEGAAGGSAADAEAARVRRLKAQGRFMPY